MIKKFLIAFAAGVGLLCGSVKAQAEPVQIIGEKNMSAKTKTVQGVLGIEFNKNSLGTNDYADTIIEDSFTAFTASAGIKIAEVFSKVGVGVSAFYQKSAQEDKYVENYYCADTTISYQAYGIDAHLYFPVFERLDLTADAGVGYYDFEMTGNYGGIGGSGSFSFSEDHIASRWGVGAELKLTENLAMTCALRYVAFVYDENNDYLENLTEVGIGLKLYF
ncbi:MAG: outer membrane beta-barrel protein [Alphaproteobacteria bacterium]